MIGEGMVVSVSGNEAMVEISKSSSCGHDCASCGVCTNPTYTMKVMNPVAASPGDRVKIESDTSKILLTVFLVYMFPVVLMIIAVFMCEIYSLGIYSVLIFAVMISVWIVLIRYINRKSGLKNIIVAVIEH